MLVKTLSVRQPYASLICYGIKTVENRSWKTDYRGRLLIHASGDHMALMPDALPGKLLKRYELWMDKGPNCPDAAPDVVKRVHGLLSDIEKFYSVDFDNDDNADFNRQLKQAIKNVGFFFRAAAIIGETELVDIVQNSKDDFAQHGCYHWILRNSKLYEKPIRNVMGRLRLWNFDIV